MDANHLEFCSTEKQLTAVKLYIEGHSEHQVAINGRFSRYRTII